MSSLYEINKKILECVDLETGEIIDPESLMNLQMERNLKIENIALWIKNLQSDAIALKAEKDAFAEREKSTLAKIKSLKNYLAFALEGQKFSTAKCVVSFRRSEKVEVTDKASIPKDFMKETVTLEPDKTAIKEAIKSGQEVGGCRLVENLNPSIT